MAGVRRGRTDNNSLILCPSGKRRKDGIRKDAVLFPLFPIPFYASHTLLQSTRGSLSDLLMALLGRIQNVCACFLSHSHTVLLHGCACSFCIPYVLARKLGLCLHVHIYLFILAPVLRHICLLSVTRLDVLLRVSLFRAI